MFLCFQLDVDTHLILSALNSAAHGKKVENRMFDANIACRKLASQHPMLLLRYSNKTLLPAPHAATQVQ